MPAILDATRADVKGRWIRVLNFMRCQVYGGWSVV
jgi:hypothetical protein